MHAPFPTVRTLSLAAALTTLAACGDTDGYGDTDTPDDSGSTDTEDTADTGSDDTGSDDTGSDDTSSVDTDVVSYAADIEPLLNGCAACHVTGSSGGFNFSGGLSDLVDVEANSADDGVVYVEPGDHENSLLWAKIDGSQATLGNNGGQMPASGPPFLSADAIDTIADWIDAGANP